MLSSILTKRSTSLVGQTKRSFARTPMIKFLGPRSKTNKSIGAYASADYGAAASAAPAETAQSDKKAISLGAELAFADLPADRWARLPFSEQEVDVINQGTNDVELDWRNIRL